VVAAARLVREARDRVGRQVAQVFQLDEVDGGVLWACRPDHHGEDLGEVVAVGDLSRAGTEVADGTAFGRGHLGRPRLQFAVFTDVGVGPVVSVDELACPAPYRPPHEQAVVAVGVVGQAGHAVGARRRRTPPCAEIGVLKLRHQPPATDLLVD
jgi:hypothetical protein